MPQDPAQRAGVRGLCKNLAPMRAITRRTLVKSAPELWELADDMSRMEAWMADLVGTPDPVRVDVTDRDPGRILAWRAAQGEAAIALELAEKGFGTSVSITAEHARPDSTQAEAVLEQLLDELGSPERRPFARR
jgi:hypothetical protein